MSVVNADDVLFSVGGFGVTPSGVVAVVAAAAACAAAYYAMRTARTAEIARRTADEAQFFGRWVILRRSFDPLDPETGEFPSSDSGPYYRVENIGRGPALNTQVPFSGMVPNGQKLDPQWRVDVPTPEFDRQDALVFRWTGVDGRPKKQKLVPGHPPEKPAVWDLRLEKFVHA